MVYEMMKTFFISHFILFPPLPCSLLPGLASPPGTVFHQSLSVTGSPSRAAEVKPQTSACWTEEGLGADHAFSQPGSLADGVSALQTSAAATSESRI